MIRFVLILSFAALPGFAADEAVTRGEYLVNLLSCGYCHTDGRLTGGAEPGPLLAGSRVGIAFTPYRDPDLPAVVFPSNLTPDPETGLGRWSDEEIARVIQSGIDRHGRQQEPVMPWIGYAYLHRSDVDAIVAYLRSVPPVRHAVPANVEAGQLSTDPWVRFGVYTFDPDGERAESVLPLRE